MIARRSRCGKSVRGIELRRDWRVRNYAKSGILRTCEVYKCLFSGLREAEERLGIDRIDQIRPLRTRVALLAGPDTVFELSPARNCQDGNDKRDRDGLGRRFRIFSQADKRRQTPTQTGLVRPEWSRNDHVVIPDRSNPVMRSSRSCVRENADVRCHFRSCERSYGKIARRQVEFRPRILGMNTGIWRVQPLNWGSHRLESQSHPRLMTGQSPFGS
jgi:hypothetical protein